MSTKNTKGTNVMQCGANRGDTIKKGFITHYSSDKCDPLQTPGKRLEAYDWDSSCPNRLI